MQKYHIYLGRDEHDAQWIEPVEGLAAAKHRMRELAVAKPGPYFVFCRARGVVVARVDTTNAGEKRKAQAAG